MLSGRVIVICNVCDRTLMKRIDLSPDYYYYLNKCDAERVRECVVNL